MIGNWIMAEDDRGGAPRGRGGMGWQGGSNRKERVPHAVTKTEASTNRFAKGRRGRGRRRGEVAYASAIINQSIIEAAQALTHSEKHIHIYISIYIIYQYTDRKTNPDGE